MDRITFNKSIDLNKRINKELNQIENSIEEIEGKIKILNSKQMSIMNYINPNFIGYLCSYIAVSSFNISNNVRNSIYVVIATSIFWMVKEFIELFLIYGLDCERYEDLIDLLLLKSEEIIKIQSLNEEKSFLFTNEEMDKLIAEYNDILIQLSDEKMYEDVGLIKQK